MRRLKHEGTVVSGRDPPNLHLKTHEPHLGSGPGTASLRIRQMCGVDFAEP